MSVSLSIMLHQFLNNFHRIKISMVISFLFHQLAPHTIWACVYQQHNSMCKSYLRIKVVEMCLLIRVAFIVCIAHILRTRTELLLQ